MRHLVGFILALVSAAALLGGGGWAVTNLSAPAAYGGGSAGVPGLLALAALAGVGLLAGILILWPAISPLATGLPGLAALAWSVLLVLSVHRALGWFPASAQAPWAGIRSMLSHGVLALSGAAMAAPLFVPSRWRSRRAGNDDDDLLPEPIGLLT
jgi:hypothetical protein